MQVLKLFTTKFHCSASVGSIATHSDMFQFVEVPIKVLLSTLCDVLTWCSMRQNYVSKLVTKGQVPKTLLCSGPQSSLHYGHRILCC